MKVIRIPFHPFGFAAMAFPTFCLVHRDLSGEILDVIVEHESVHARQMRSWFYWPIYVLRYFFSRPFRARSEAEAYGRTQLARWGPSRSKAFAMMIHDKYNLMNFGFGKWPSESAIEYLLINYYRDETSQ